ncbi:MAG: hypothetical protein U5R48_14855 [Gammaproteobacteria bacterium]|nr:hypothetical protein [Gammaproteobacteria bacterium]
MTIQAAGADGAVRLGDGTDGGDLTLTVAGDTLTLNGSGATTTITADTTWQTNNAPIDLNDSVEFADGGTVAYTLDSIGTTQD